MEELATSSGWPAILLSGLGGGLVGGFVAELGRRFSWRRDRRHDAYAGLLDAAADFDETFGDTALAVIRGDRAADGEGAEFKAAALRLRTQLHRADLVGSRRFEVATSQLDVLLSEALDALENVPEFDARDWVDRWLKAMNGVYHAARVDLGFRWRRRNREQ